MTNNVPFPQADDFEKVILIVNITDEELLRDTAFMKKYLKGITGRQVSYFLSAAMYLNLINKDKKFTNLGMRIRSISNHKMQIIELLNVLMNDDIIRYAFLYEKIQHVPLKNDYIAKMILNKYPNYSTQTCRRRGQTVRGWVEWMKKQLR